ncbi:hypothetical protein RhiirA1_462575 [Rhizophagus irregularis]|uniref:Uncharacterized protein n=1 Tax=Rhizophagus irregularis TaxID=588596 RepID=A0A2N0RLZ6_9GLOM|nr:hypothetical protein RhiirA1_462575 [Rhizophagus irregularis]
MAKRSNLGYQQLLWKCGSVEVGDIEFICSLKKKVKSKITSIFKSMKDNKASSNTSKGNTASSHQFLKVIIVIFIKYTTYPLEIRINLELKKSKLEIELQELGKLEDKIQKIKADLQKIEGVLIRPYMVVFSLIQFLTYKFSHQ